MWRKGKPHALLVGMQAGATTMENSMEYPRKLKNRTAIQYMNSTSAYLSKENESTGSKRYMHPMFIAALFTTTKMWKQPKCPSIHEC